LKFGRSLQDVHGGHYDIGARTIEERYAAELCYLSNEWACLSSSRPHPSLSRPSEQTWATVRTCGVVPCSLMEMQWRQRCRKTVSQGMLFSAWLPRGLGMKLRAMRAQRMCSVSPSPRDCVLDGATCSRSPSASYTGGERSYVHGFRGTASACSRKPGEARRRRYDFRRVLSAGGSRVARLRTQDSELATGPLALFVIEACDRRTGLSERERTRGSRHK
jgi:hypothetical protein